MQTFILAQDPPTPEGTIIKVEATSINDAIGQLQTLLDKPLTRLGAGYWSDGDEKYFLYFDAKGLEQFAELFQQELTLRDMMNQLVIDAARFIKHFTTGDKHWETCNALADQYHLWSDNDDEGESHFPLWLSAVVSDAYWTSRVYERVLHELQAKPRILEILESLDCP